MSQSRFREDNSLTIDPDNPIIEYPDTDNKPMTEGNVRYERPVKRLM